MILPTPAAGGDPATVAARTILAQIDPAPVVWRAPLLVGIFGLPGAGKTAIAGWLAARYPLVALSTDALRLRHGLPSGPATIDALYTVAAALLPRRAAILFDGIHLGRRDRDRLRAFAAAHAARSAIIHVVADRAVIEQRLAARRRDPAQTAAEGKFVITPAHFDQIAAWLEPPDATEVVWTIDTTHSLDVPPLAAFSRWLDGFAADTGAGIAPGQRC